MAASSQYSNGHILSTSSTHLQRSAPADETIARLERPASGSTRAPTTTTTPSVLPKRAHRAHLAFVRAEPEPPPSTYPPTPPPHRNNDLDLLPLRPQIPLHNLRLRPQLLPQLRLLPQAARGLHVPPHLLAPPDLTVLLHILHHHHLLLLLLPPPPPLSSSSSYARFFFQVHIDDSLLLLLRRQAPAGARGAYGGRGGVLVMLAVVVVVAVVLLLWPVVLLVLALVLVLAEEALPRAVPLQASIELACMLAAPGQRPDPYMCQAFEGQRRVTSKLRKGFLSAKAQAPHRGRAQSRDMGARPGEFMRCGRQPSTQHPARTRDLSLTPLRTLPTSASYPPATAYPSIACRFWTGSDDDGCDGDLPSLQPPSVRPWPDPAPCIGEPIAAAAAAAAGCKHAWP
ncbi:hypothetical protein EDC01DRAFT_753815 [Geopyxis carbonaria]|nr:hypothetical protein EDC01DRAFT_753815 [Geopyxis carbonaria]